MLNTEESSKDADFPYPITTFGERLIEALECTTFGERLIEALEYQGITDTVQQVEKIAKACQITARTAKKYLQATTTPLFLKHHLWRIDALQKYLDVPGGWLLHGGMSLEDMRFLKYIRSLTKWERDRTFRLAVRLLNDCPKARRLIDMENSGQISRGQLLAAM